MKTVASALLVILSFTALAQKQTFDLITYTVPKGWKQTANSADVVGYAITNDAKGTYCQVALYKSMGTMGNAQLDFDTDWKDLITSTYAVTTAPQMTPATTQAGWNKITGTAPFAYNGGQSQAELITLSGFGKRVSILILSNTKDYKTITDNFIATLELKKTEEAVQPVAETNTSIAGTWTMSTSDQSSYRVNNGISNAITRQYTFSDKGTYTFYTKSFDQLMNAILLSRENGTYQISGNHLTIMPEKSVLEAYSKKDGSDKWGTLLSTQNKQLEKVTYQYTKHYFSGIQEWNLVLQASTPTLREGPFSNNTTFTNAYYYSPLSANHPVMELPGSQPAPETKKPSASAPVKSTYSFTTTNFDDGWTGTEQADWVMVTKGKVKVLVHYPNEQVGYNSDLLAGLQNAWNVLVAGKYTSVHNLEFKPISSWQSIEFAEADAVERAGGQSVHVVLFKVNYYNGSGKYLEIITPDKKTYEQEFGPYQQSSSGWEKVEGMVNYNKFAVAATDLVGTWTSDFSGMIQYVNANTGADAGANAHASNEFFEFRKDNTYHWELGMASGMVGNMKFQSAKSDGKHTLPNNWQIQFSDLEGKPKTYNAFFSCIKGARLLWLEDSAYANGYKAYGKKE
ncbi:MAG TPA: hypothetical protein DIS90_02445 [Cytophagales bacterium]|nr:hypothetical protein [Cytophagales bacterium]